MSPTKTLPVTGAPAHRFVPPPRFHPLHNGALDPRGHSVHHKLIRSHSLKHPSLPCLGPHTNPDPPTPSQIGEELNNLVYQLERVAQVKVKPNMAILSLICNVERTSEILMRTFKVLIQEGINVNMMSQGASKVRGAGGGLRKHSKGCQVLGHDRLEARSVGQGHKYGSNDLTSVWIAYPRGSGKV